ncbi:GDP-mannose 4,6-dehydratase [Marispirochaeta sp.]|uniref:GDP-mannose 4,6-dehydratase n=1 Tax=Marispirochaeta sp. TaxID=2038653 RepID=UPI0029C8EC8D|nr:GDP-mannose 4,6-dehydratase [Marispirochaeta sp.]
MRIIITGAAGFIGSNLSRRLVGEHSIIGIDNFDPFYDRRIKENNLTSLNRHQNFRLYEADIADASGTEKIFLETKPELVVHLAAKAGVRPSIEDPAGYAETNINGTISLLQAARKAGIRDFVFASSSSVYGNTKEVPFTESSFVDHPISPYAATKKAGELICHTYSHLYGMRIASLRFFTVYGRGQRPDLAIAKFTRMIDRNEEIPFYGDGTTERDYTYIGDIIDGTTRSMDWLKTQPEGTHEVFNLGEGRTTTLTDLVASIEAALGKKARIKRLPMQPGDVLRTYADVSKAREAFGYNPSTLLTDGVQAYVQWYREKSGERSI